MWEIFRATLSSSEFMPHGNCYLWKPQLVGLHLSADLTIAVAYYSIPLLLLYFINKRKDVPFRKILILFSAFIVACGTTHLIAVWTLWYPLYWLSGIIKALTALVSIYTTFVLIPIIPKALTLPGFGELEEINSQLTSQVRERQVLISKIRQLNSELEERVEQRTQELQCSNQELAKEIAERKQQEKRLRLLERAIAASNNGIVIADATNNDYPVIYVNPAFEKITGYKREEVIGKNCRFLQGEDRQQSALVKLRTVLQKQASCRVVLRNYRRDGTLFWNELSVSPVKDESGTVTHYIGVQADITERELAEEALKESEERFRQLAENIQQVFWMVDSQRKGMIYTSPSYEKVWGRSLEDLYKNPLAFTEAIHPEDHSKVIEDITQGRQFEHEYRIVRPDNSLRWIHDRAFPVRNEAGEVYRLAGIAEDITERKQYEAALEREHQQLQQIVAQAPVAMAMFDTEMAYIAHSNKWLEDYDLGEEPLTGCICAEVFPDMPKSWQDAHRRALQGEVTSTPEDVYERKDGSKIYLRWAVHPWYTHNNKIGGIVLVSDQINELVEAREAALEASRLKSQFLANMSHEIRTPMNGVLGMTDLLMRTPLNPQQENFVKTLSVSAKNLLLIINDILDVSKLEAGKMPLEMVDFELNSCIQEVIDLLANEAHRKKLALCSLVDEDVVNHLKGDDRRLRQVLINLVGNAIKFTDAGEVMLRVSLAGETQSEVVLRFEVEDTGMGITVREQENLFKAFHQLDTSTTRKHGGTGLGLVICKQIVELIGGEIGVISETGKGSTFWFTAQFDKQSAPSSSSTQITTELSDLKILVVDSHATHRQVINAHLAAYQVQIDEVETTPAAIAALRQAANSHPYDLALIDLQSPEINGEALCQLIRCDPILAGIQWIVMVSIHQHQQVKRLLKQGASGYLLKPLSASRLRECLLHIAHKWVTPLGAQAEELARREKQPHLASMLPRISPQVPADLKILLVEDTPVNQRVVVNQLNMLGYEADCVANGALALEKLAQQDYDLVLMDCLMPVLDGYKTTQALRQRESGSERHTIVVAMTANAMKGEKQHCLQFGMDDYLSKPITLDMLERVIERWLPLIAQQKQRGNSSLAAQSCRLVSPGSYEAQERGQLLTRGKIQSSQDQEAPLNLERLQEISRNNLELQLEMLTIFLEDAPLYLANIKQAEAAGNMEKLAVDAHQLKGAANMVAVREMPQLAYQLEQKARQRSLEGAKEIIRQLEETLERVRFFVQR